MKLMLCKQCGEEFVLRPGKPGYANVCEDCSGLHQPTPAPPEPVKQVRTRPRSLASHRRSLRRACNNLSAALKDCGMYDDNVGNLLHEIGGK